MRKLSVGQSTRGGRARRTKEPVAKVTPPLTINIVTAAFFVMVLGNIARGLLLLGSTPTLQKFVTNSNKNAKKPDKNFNVADSVHTLRQGALIQALIFGAVLLLLAYAMRRSRSASGTRWAVLIIFVYTALPFYVIPTKGLPPSVQAAGVVIGIASIAAILLIFIPPQSKAYFRECRQASTPADLQGKPRPGLASLFGPKRPAGPAPARGGGLLGGGLFGGGRGAAGRGAAGQRGAGAAARSAPQAGTAARPMTPAKAKAKVRTNTDAVAKGAELARSRAKASKSRRTPE